MYNLLDKIYLERGNIVAAYRGTRGVEPPKPKKEKVSKATNSDFIDISSKSTKAVHKKRNTFTAD